MQLDEDDGERKLVALPLERDHKEETPSSVVRRAERLLASRLGDKCFVYSAGWWSYEVCFRDSIRQYHLEGQATPSIYHSLGKFNPSVSAPSRPPAAPRFWTGVASCQARGGTLRLSPPICLFPI